MTEKAKKKVDGRWSHGKRRELSEEAAKKAGYPGALREEHGWWRGARVTRRT